MNPILPMNYYIPDVEARQWNNKKIYLYGSKDIPGNDEYCSYDYQVFSSEDLIHWCRHDNVFTSQNHGLYSAHKTSPLYAPDCAYIHNKYYLFYCQADNAEGFAVSDNPEGPFHDALPISPADNDSIDPAVLVDDDGSVYYYWGQYHAKGGKLSSDLRTVTSITDNLLTEEEHGFHEGISIRKRNGLYYLSFSDISRGRPTCIGYAVSRNPLGPFVKKNIIIDNTGCDPQTWNNHGSIACINGEWYVFYHRSTHNSFFSRQVCAEKINFNEDGTIDEVEMTTQGIEGPLACSRTMEAYRACMLSGSVYVDDYSDENNSYEYLTNIHNGDWAVYKYINFDKGITETTIEASSQSYGGTIQIFLDMLESEPVGTIEIKGTGGKYEFRPFKGRIKPDVSGIHAVYLKFTGNKGILMNLKEFRFM